LGILGDGERTLMAQVRKGQAPDRLSRVARAVPQVTAALRGGELDDATAARRSPRPK